VFGLFFFSVYFSFVKERKIVKMDIVRGKAIDKDMLDVLSVLATKVNSCKEGLNAQVVGNSLYGLQKMSSDHDEVRDVLSALAMKVDSCKEDLNAQALGNALYGLQRMSSDHVEVRDVLSALSRGLFGGLCGGPLLVWVHR
jgi:hypothetical protein